MAQAGTLPYVLVHEDMNLEQGYAAYNLEIVKMCTSKGKYKGEWNNGLHRLAIKTTLRQKCMISIEQMASTYGHMDPL